MSMRLKEAKLSLTILIFFNAISKSRYGVTALLFFFGKPIAFELSVDVAVVLTLCFYFSQAGFAV